MIEITNLRHREITINSLTIRPGITSVIGANGSGKTTFLRLCAGIAIPETGSILIDNAPPRETETGWVNEYPDKNLLFSKAYDEIASSLRFRRFDCDETKKWVCRIANDMQITPLLDRETRELSGGEKVLVALAAALVHRPKVLVLDECDSHLDATRCDQIEQAIQASGAHYTIRCTQQMERAAQGDRLLFFDHGRIAHDGSPSAVFASLAQTPFYPLSWRCNV